MVGDNLVGGGDIEGLHTLGASVSSAGEPFSSARHALDKAVDQVVWNAGWYGNAASAMRASWAVDTTKVGVLADATRWLGRTVTELASSLGDINRRLHDAAYQATRSGVALRADGAPLPLTCAAALTTVHATGQYTATRRRLLDEAAAARGLAHARLSALVGAITDPLTTDPSARAWVQTQNVLRGLYTAPDKAADVTKAAGLKDLAAKLPGSHEMRTPVKPLPGFLSLNKVPILSWGATAVSAGLKTNEDIQRGWNPVAAVGANYSAGAAGTVAGTVTTGAIIGAAGIGAGTTVGVGIAVVGGAAIVGTLVGSGVGGAVSQAFHENWAHDIEEHGVVGGVATGAGHVLDAGAQEIGNTVKSVGDVASSLWKGITGH